MFSSSFQRYEEDLLVLGSGVGIKFLNKVHSWGKIKDLMKKVNPQLFFRIEKTPEFENMKDDEATKCCQNTSSFVNPGIVWPGNATAYVMQSSAVNAAWAFLARQVGHKHSIQKSIFEQYKKFLKTEFFSKINTMIDPSLKIKFEDILKKHSDGKQKLYRSGFEKAVRTSKVDTNMDLMQKTNELKFDTDIKPRNLFNPSASLKALGSYIGQVLIVWARECVPGFMVGYNTGDLCDKLTTCYRMLRDPIICTWDGSNHDAHQFAELINEVDTPMLELLFEQAWAACIDLPFDTELKASLYKCLTDTDIKIVFNNPAYKAKKGEKRFQRLFKGKLRGTVFSGHPTRTTWGNTLRVLSYAHFIKYLAKIPDNEIYIFAAGDDMLIFMERKHQEVFYLNYRKVYIYEELLAMETELGICHGLGQVGKTFNISENKVDFLSKFGLVTADGTIVMNRQIIRTVMGANTTCKIQDHHIDTKAKFGAFNYVITAGLESWGTQWPVIDRYIQYRKETLHHGFPSKKALSRFNDSETGFYLKYHKNTYNYGDMGYYQELVCALGHNEVFMALHEPSMIPELFC